MGVVVIGHAPNGEMYEAVVNAMLEANDGEMPVVAGLVVHTASRLTDA